MTLSTIMSKIGKRTFLRVEFIGKRSFCFLRLLHVPAASLGKVYEVLIYSLEKVLQNQIIRWKKCEAYYSTLCFRSEKNAFIPTKNRTYDYL